MKKIIGLIFVLLLALPTVFAQNEVAGNGNGDGAGNGEAGNATPVATPISAYQAGNLSQVREQARVLQDNASANASVVEQVRERIRQGLDQDFNPSNMTGPEVKAMVRERVTQRVQMINNTSRPLPRAEHAAKLVQYVRNLKDISGINDSGIGQNVSRMAQQLNTSVQEMGRAEERVRAQGIGVRIRNFFFGGDDQAANQILREANTTRQRMQELHELRNQYQDPEVRQLIQEQVQGLNQTVQSMEQLARQEKQKRGIFSFLLG